jgi:hypothetical protein
MSNFIFIYLFIFLSINCVTSYSAANNAVNNNNAVSVFQNSNNHILAMVKDYTLIDLPVDNSNIINEFSLNQYKEKENEKNNIKPLNKRSIWFTNVKQFLALMTTDDNELLEPFEVRVQNHVDSLNRVIINASDGLVNMCNKMIEKTTSSLPLSYSSYAKFETEIQANGFNKEELKEEEAEESGGFFDFFSSKTESTKKNALVVVNSVKDKEEIEAQIVKQMYDYQLYRLALNNRQSFLNSLCFNTFGDPYILYYNSDNNTLSFAFEKTPIDYYAVIVQNIIDNSLVRNLNRGFKHQMNSNKEEQLKYDVNFDIDKDKKSSLNEKSTYILPILQKLSQRLPTYLSDIAKRSLTIDEYFQNIQQFWTTILDESIIASHESPLKYKLELDRLKIEKEILLQKQINAEHEEQRKMHLAVLEAQRIKDEYKKKSIIDDAHDFVRQNEILLNERQQNFSDKEWQQFNQRFLHHISGAIGLYDSTINGLGQLLHSTLSVPTNVVINFASTQVSQIGKLLILVAGVVIIGLMTLFFTKLFIRRITRLFWNTEKKEKSE